MHLRPKTKNKPQKLKIVLSVLHAYVLLHFALLFTTFLSDMHSYNISSRSGWESDNLTTVLISKLTLSGIVDHSLILTEKLNYK